MLKIGVINYWGVHFTVVIAAKGGLLIWGGGGIILVLEWKCPHFDGGGHLYKSMLMSARTI